jgi:hypothetical protein
MNKLFLLSLFFISSSLFAQGSLDFLVNSKREKPKSNQYVLNGQKSNYSQTVSKSTDAKNCLTKDEDHLSLKYLSALLRYEGDAFNITHDAVKGVIQLKAGPIISNCSSMISFELRAPSTENQNYIVSAKIHKPNNCAQGVCEYKVVEKNGSNVEEKIINVTPNTSGFIECLKQTGVINDSGLNNEKVVEKEFGRELNGAFSSAQNVLFASQYPSFSGAVFNKEMDGDDCLVYETMSTEKIALRSVADAESERINNEALKACNTNNYKTINEFLSRYNSFESSLGKIRNELILKSIVQLAKDLNDGKKPADLDFSVVDDFQKYIVDPLANEARILYKELAALPDGPEKKEKQIELDAILTQIKSLRKAPYIESKHVETLLTAGQFDEASKIQSYRLTLQHHSQLGKKVENVLITPEIAQARINDGLDSFEIALADKRREYEVKTGQVTGKSQFYASLAKKYRDQIPVRTANYTKAVQQEYLKTIPPQQCGQMRSPCGYCYQYFRNTQRCLQRVVQTTDGLKRSLTQLNTQDTQIAAELDEKSVQYGAWEAEGQRYVATQSGDSEEADGDDKYSPDDITPPATSTEAPVVADDQVYNFDYQQQQFNNPNQFQNQFQYQGQNQFQNQYQFPNYNMNMQGNYNYNQYQSPYMSNQGYNFNFGANNTGFQQNPWVNNQNFNGGFNNNFGFANQNNGYQFNPNYYGPNFR